MDALKVLAALRAAGSMSVAAYNEVRAANPNIAEAEIATAEQAVRDNTKTAGAPPALKIAAAPTVNDLLSKARFLANGARIDPIMPSGTPGTVTLPKTGHVLSLPNIIADDNKYNDEMFVGYCTRVSDQATGGQGDKYLGGLGMLFLGTSSLFERFGGFKADGSNWPAAADCFYNLRAYMTPEEIAEDEARKKGWEPVYDRMREQGKQSNAVNTTPVNSSTPTLPGVGIE